MGRIRLQVRVLPWEEAGAEASGSAQLRQETLRPWLQVCSEEMTLQDLADQIVHKFSSIYAGKGTLNIKHLESDLGDLLDLNDRVGDVFDDRSPSGEIRTSIVKVARYPPDPGELRTPARFGSLMPESSARPKKRPLGYSPPEQARHAVSPLQSVERWGSGQPLAVAHGPNKRHKTHGSSRLNGVEESDQEEPRIFSQTIGAQHPVQVHDSQHSPPRNHTNLYGTPTSLSQDQLLLPQRDGEVPDSPTHRRATTVDLDRERTKSESPELCVSVHDTPPFNIETAPSTQHENAASNAQRSSGPAAGALQQTLLESQANSSFQISSPQIPPLSKFQSNQPDRPSRSGEPDASTGDQSSKSSGQSQRKGADIFDPIDSDTESFLEKAQLHSSKRLRLNKEPGKSSRQTTSTRKNPTTRSGVFKVPPLPSTHATRGSETSPSGELPMSHLKNSQGLMIAAGLDARLHSQPESISTATSNIDQHLSQQRPALEEEGVEIRAASLPQAMGSPMRREKAFSTSNRLGQHRQSQTTSPPHTQQASGRTETTMTDEPNEELMLTERERSPREAREQEEQAEAAKLAADQAEADRKARALKQQQEAEQTRLSKERAEQERVAEQEAEAARLAAEQVEAGRKTESTRVAEERKSRQEKEKAEEAVRHERDRAAARLEGERHADALLANRRAEREKIRREEELAKQGERMMSAADGAKQLEAEKAKTPKKPPTTPTPRSVKTSGAPKSRSSTPGVLKYPPRTEEQKIKRQQRESKRKEDERRKKIEEGKRAFERARFLADDNAREVVKMSKSPFPSSGPKGLSPSVSGPASSSPISSKSSAAPLRSILRGSSSALGRSESFQETARMSPDWTKSDKSLPAPAPITTYGVTPSNSLRDLNNIPKSLRDLNSSLVASNTSPAVRGYGSMPLKPPHEVDYSKLGSNQKMKQSKLNVKVDRKMKGKMVIDSIPRLDEVEELVVSDDEKEISSVSTWYSEDERNGVARPGPSSKSKSRSNAEKSTAKDSKPQPRKLSSAGSVASSIQLAPNVASSPKDLITSNKEPSLDIDPALRNVNFSQSQVSTVGSTAASTNDVASVAEQKSMSRSPARQRARTESSSSDSEVEHGKSVDLEDSVDSDESNESDDSDDSEVDSPPVEKVASHKTKASHASVFVSQGIAKDIKTGKLRNVKHTKASIPAMDGAESTLSSHEGSLATQRLTSTPSCNGIQVDPANVQLQSEHRASLSPNRPRKSSQAMPTSSTITTAPRAGNSQLSNKLKVNGAKSKPEKFRYPKLSEMMRVAKDLPPQDSAPSSSAGGPAKKTFEDEAEDSSDSEDEDDSDSEQEGLGASMMKGLKNLAANYRKHAAKAQT